jgi:predicted metal-dependent hydrolase
VVISNLAIAIDEELIKYLIVHEISHLVRGAHDKKF